MEVISGAGRFMPPAGQDRNHWIEHLRVADLSVGTYSVPQDGVDDQVPPAVRCCGPGRTAPRSAQDR
jgi:hypothetical protein